ncbi:MAG TPA: hypothetical protein VKZ42_05180, partial [Flavobacteriaceae bacterium]|nr:hypothetical protein [Flavobacteriaceae bacterium]
CLVGDFNGSDGHKIGVKIFVKLLKKETPSVNTFLTIGQCIGLFEKVPLYHNLKKKGNFHEKY